MILLLPIIWSSDSKLLYSSTKKKVEHSNGFVLDDSTWAVFNWLCSEKDNILISKIENHFKVQIVEVKSPLWLIWSSMNLYRKVENFHTYFGNHPEYYMFDQTGPCFWCVVQDKMHLYRLRLVITLVTSAANNARKKVMKACQMWLIEAACNMEGHWWDLTCIRVGLVVPVVHN